MTCMTQNNCSTIDSTLIGATNKRQHNFLETLRIWNDRYKSRQQLAGLEPQMLKDIGISYEDAQKEATIPFWLSK